MKGKCTMEVTDAMMLLQTTTDMMVLKTAFVELVDRVQGLEKELLERDKELKLKNEHLTDTVNELIGVVSTLGGTVAFLGRNSFKPEDKPTPTKQWSDKDFQTHVLVPELGGHELDPMEGNVTPAVEIFNTVVRHSARTINRTMTEALNVNMVGVTKLFVDQEHLSRSNKSMSGGQGVLEEDQVRKTTQEIVRERAEDDGVNYDPEPL